TFSNIPGTLNNLTAQADLDFTPPGASAFLTGSLTLNSTLTLGETARLIANGNTAINGNGTLLLPNFPINTIYLAATNTTLTLCPCIHVRGGGTSASSANLGYSAWFCGGDNLSVINNGTIHSNSAGSSIAIDTRGGTFISSGTLMGPGNFSFSNGAMQI